MPDHVPIERARRERSAAASGTSWLAVALAWSLWSASASAQRLDLSTFAPPPSDAATFTIAAPAAPSHGTIEIGLFTDYAHRLLDRSIDCQGRIDPACGGGRTAASIKVPHLAESALLLDVALFDALTLGVALPVSLTEVDANGATTAAGLSDLNLALKVTMLGRGATRVAFQGQLSLPTASKTSWTGEPEVSVTPAVIISQAIGRVTLAAELGYHIRRRQQLLGIEQDDELVLAIGAHYPLTRSLAAVGELNARLGVGGRRFDRAESPEEIDLGLRIGGLPGVQLDLGVGTAAWPGERGAGAPDVRGFLILRTAFETARCEFGPEDYDGFEDADGCNDPDNDRDGIADAEDACPNDPEDYDGFEDSDGCPDPDNDADGIPDARDLCPEQSEDLDGFQDRDGCPEPDNDADGIPDGRDHCKLDPEDHDGFEDDDGCPEPGPGRPTVTVSGSRLLMSDRIYFEDEADTIRAVSTVALDALAATLKSLPGHPRVRVEGHTDDSGNPQYNIDLSYRRARAVVAYLRAQGVDPAQLEYVGRGSSQPIAPNDSADGRALNRRVEFVLIDR